MEIILRNDIPKLGKAYDVVKVKAGYARNYLLPKNLAFRVTQANLEKIEKEKKAKKLAGEKDKSHYKEICSSLSGKSFTIPVATNEEEKLYAGVSKEEIVEAVKLEGIDIQPNNVLMEQAIKELGIYEIEVRLKYDIVAKIKIWIVKK
ncbi:MAG: 50S ribosomal protein L9 [Candidatus Omnitrophica bacterium]|nr:50S ribosomal protein L9 [Candidatus Omnitrophota bacterium]